MSKYMCYKSKFTMTQPLLMYKVIIMIGSEKYVDEIHFR